MKKYVSIAIFLSVVLIAILSVIFFQGRADVVEQSVSVAQTPYSEGNVLTSDNVSIHYWFYERGTDVVAVYLHGGPCGDTHAMRTTKKADALADAVGSLLLFDQRGCGESQHDVPEDTFTFARSTQDIQEVIEAIIPKRSIVVMGASFGGVQAIHFAQLHHPQVIAYILVAPAPLDDNLMRTVDSVKTEAYKQAQREVLREESALLSAREDAAFSSISSEDQMARSANQQRVGDTWTKNELSETVDFIQLLAAMQNIPTLVMYGEYDHRTPGELIEKMKERFPTAEYVMFSMAGHYFSLTQPTAYVNTLTKFVSELSQLPE